MSHEPVITLVELIDNKQITHITNIYVCMYTVDCFSKVLLNLQNISYHALQLSKNPLVHMCLDKYILILYICTYKISVLTHYSPKHCERSDTLTSVQSTPSDLLPTLISVIATV